MEKLCGILSGHLNFILVRRLSSVRCLMKTPCCFSELRKRHLFNFEDDRDDIPSCTIVLVEVAVDWLTAYSTGSYLSVFSNNGFPLWKLGWTLQVRRETTPQPTNPEMSGFENRVV